MGVGSPSHLAGELFNARAGVKLVHVPYKGGGPVSEALLGGEVQVFFGSVAALLPQIKAGKLRALAVTGLKRAPTMPDVPTVAESGFPGFDVTSWYSILVPTGTPQPVIARLFSDSQQVMQMPDVRDALDKQGLDVEISKNSAEVAEKIKAETAQWTKLIKEVGIHAE